MNDMQNRCMCSNMLFFKFCSIPSAIWLSLSFVVLMLCCFCIPKNFRRVQQNLNKQRRFIVYVTILLAVVKFHMEKRTNRVYNLQIHKSPTNNKYLPKFLCVCVFVKEKLSARFSYLNMIALSKQANL